LNCSPHPRSVIKSCLEVIRCLPSRPGKSVQDHQEQRKRKLWSAAVVDWAKTKLSADPPQPESICQMSTTLERSSGPTCRAVRAGNPGSVLGQVVHAPKPSSSREEGKPHCRGSCHTPQAPSPHGTRRPMQLAGPTLLGAQAGTSTSRKLGMQLCIRTANPRTYFHNSMEMTPTFNPEMEPPGSSSHLQRPANCFSWLSDGRMYSCQTINQVAIFMCMTPSYLYVWTLFCLPVIRLQRASCPLAQLNPCNGLHAAICLAFTPSPRKGLEQSSGS
jgi:hypothetical protein